VPPKDSVHPKAESLLLRCVASMLQGENCTT